MMVLSRDLFERARQRRNRLIFLTERQRRFVSDVLSKEEREIVSDPNDLIYVAAVNNLLRKNPERALRIDRSYVSSDLGHYCLIQQSWVRTEEYLIGIRVGHKPTVPELREDFAKYQNGIRFKLFYFLKWPERVVRVNG